MIREIRRFWIPPGGGGGNPFSLNILGCCEVHNPSQTCFTKIVLPKNRQGSTFCKKVFINFEVRRFWIPPGGGKNPNFKIQVLRGAQPPVTIVDEK